MKQLYLITGAAGHLGNALLSELAGQGKSVRALVLPGETHLPAAPVALFYGNVCDSQSMQAFFTAPADTELIVIHAAGIVSIASKHDQRVYDVNVGGTQNVVAQCVQHQVKKLVHISSVHAIPTQQGKSVLSEVDHFDPDAVHGLYARTKAIASQVVLDAAAAGLNASIVHPAGIIGPYDYGRGHLTALIVDYLKGSLSACIAGGYDFVDVRDVAKGIVACAEHGQRGACYILSNEFYAVKDVLCMLHEITGRREIKHILPAWFAKATAPLAEAYYKLLRKPPLFTAYSIEVLENDDHFTHEKATRAFGYAPRPLMETLRDTVTWMKENKRVP